MASDASAQVTLFFPSHSRLNTQNQNHLLNQLPAPDRERLVSRSARIAGKSRALVYPQNGAVTHVYFPLSGVISLVRTGENGTDTIEVGMVGNEGMAGLPGFLGAWKTPASAMWQAPGEAYRMGADAFHEELKMSPALRALLGRYAVAVSAQMMQSVLCNSFHPIEQRLCRWLLMSHDRVGVDGLPLTQEFIAQMLGIRRPSVTVAAGQLQRAGLIRYRRGTITVLDRRSIETGACECYGTVRRDMESLLLP